MSARRAIVAALVLLALAGAGCQATSATYPFPKDMVWKAAAGEALVWRPDRIDNEAYTITGSKTDLSGLRHDYRLTVRDDLNPFVRRPSTEVAVTMEELRPSDKWYARPVKPADPRVKDQTPRKMEITRLKEVERDFLTRLAYRLRAASGG